MSRAAVLIVGFNRPQSLEKVLGAVNRYSPRSVYVSCDGPRATVPGDTALVELSRAVAESFEWNCEVHTKYEDRNLGLRKSMTSSIDWFFENEPEGIILEDDCVPSPDFFDFMEYVLEKYREEKKVWGATGSNPSLAKVPGLASYGFVRTALVWGWCTWADRWADYDRDLSAYRTSGMAGKLSNWPDPYEYHAHDWQLRQIVKGRLKTSWAYPWSWTVVQNDGLWAVPRANLIRNIGFGHEATNTTSIPRVEDGIGSLGRIHSPKQAQRSVDLQRSIHRHHHRVLEPLWLNYWRNSYRIIRTFVFRKTMEHGVNRPGFCS